MKYLIALIVGAVVTIGLSVLITGKGYDGASAGVGFMFLASVMMIVAKSGDWKQSPYVLAVVASAVSIAVTAFSHLVWL